MLIIVATNNPDKLREMQATARSYGAEVVAASEFGEMPDPEETGSTLEENAILKNVAFQEALMEAEAPSSAWVVTEDSGLFIEALDGEPGIYAARWAGNHDDDANNRKLVQELEDRGVTTSPAYYRTVVAMSRLGDTHSTITVDGTLYVTARTVPSGAGGFGYDPYTYIGDLSLADLPPEYKNRISSRGLAFRKALDTMTRPHANPGNPNISGYTFLPPGSSPRDVTDPDITWFETGDDDTPVERIIRGIEDMVEDESYGNETIGQVYLTPLSDGTVLLWLEVIPT